MTTTAEGRQPATAANITLYPWFKACQSLVFWQAVWFLFFQDRLSAAEAILLYAIYDVGTTLLEVPSGYLSDRVGRRATLILSALAGLGGAALLSVGDSFAVFAAAQVLLGAAGAFASGTDSALLYESLADQGREGEIERHEMRAWRFSFASLAVSAVGGGAMYLALDTLPFLAGMLSAGAAVVLALRFDEPRHRAPAPVAGIGRWRLGSLSAALTEPALLWLFCLSVLMYVFSHVPYVFGQPFILDALHNTGFAVNAALVSGAVTATMMLFSVATSLAAPHLRRRFGLPAVALVAFGMQIALGGLLAATNAPVAIALLFLRMVPDSLSKPFIIARIQPLLQGETRATYMSLQSFCGRLVFAASLWLAAGAASTRGEMVYAEIRQVLGIYTAVGVLCLAALALAARRVRIDRSDM